MASSLQGFTDDNRLQGSFYSSRNSYQAMNTSNYSTKLPNNSFLNVSPVLQMRSSGYSYNGSIANDSNGFYPTTVSTPAYYKFNQDTINIDKLVSQIIFYKIYSKFFIS